MWSTPIFLGCGLSSDDKLFFGVKCSIVAFADRAINNPGDCSPGYDSL
jgi:hypothetical protein